MLCGLCRQENYLVVTSSNRMICSVSEEELLARANPRLFEFVSLHFSGRILITLAVYHCVPGYVVNAHRRECELSER